MRASTSCCSAENFEFGLTWKLGVAGGGGREAVVAGGRGAVVVGAGAVGAVAAAVVGRRRGRGTLAPAIGAGGVGTVWASTGPTATSASASRRATTRRRCARLTGLPS